MKIELKRLRLVNFKGIRSLEINFSHRTNIFGNNATGKTTIFDAFSWLLFGKDSTDRSDTNFEIKTLDSRGRVIPKLDHEVEADIEVQGQTITIKRTLREKWVKKRGSSEATFEGNEVVYEWNSVPLKQSEFKERINEIIPENLFKLLTNTNYFNSLSWQERRAVLIKMAGSISVSEVAQGDPALEELVKELSKYRDWADFKKHIAAAKKKIKDELDYIPARIDEANRSILNIQTDFPAIEAIISALKTDLQAVEQGIENEVEAAKSANESAKQAMTLIHEKRSRVLQIESAVRTEILSGRLNRESEIAQLKNKSRAKSDEISALEKTISNLTSRIDAAKSRQSGLRDEWNNLNKQQYTHPVELKFDEKDFCCPTCKRAFDDVDIEAKKAEVTRNFETDRAERERRFLEDKSRRLNEISSEGKQLTELIEQMSGELSRITAEKNNYLTQLQSVINSIAELEAKHNQFNQSEEQQILTAISNNAEIQTLNKEAADLEPQTKVVASKTLEELKEKRKILTEKINELSKQLAGKTMIEQAKARIRELEEDERVKSQEVADLEKKEFDISRFTSIEMDIVENRINSRFSFVKFQMFDTTNDGSKFDNCITFVNGVPYPDANNAARINAGLDIIRTLSQEYNVFAPVFIDNAESVTSLIDVDSQVIRLVVSEIDEFLRIQSEEMHEVA